jgi:hypothetical protein
MCDKCTRYKNRGCKYDIEKKFDVGIPIPPRSRFHQQAQNIRAALLEMPANTSWLLGREFEKCHLIGLRSFVTNQIRSLEVENKLLTSDFSIRTLEMPEGDYELRLFKLK